jgi:hypothetical protein
VPGRIDPFTGTVAPDLDTLMNCCFSGEKIPTDKLFVLYYPPSMAHQNWTKSVYAAARAREAVAATVDELTNFHSRYVIGKKLWPQLGLGLVGAALLSYSAWTLATGWATAGFVAKMLLPFVGLVLAWFGRVRYQAFAERKRIWAETAGATVERELKEIEALRAALAQDPSAEESAAILRRECPEELSEIAFQGKFFRAFTYLDFVLFSKLKNPVQKEELPAQHSLNRDAYYVGEVVFDSWRTFHRDRRDIIDPRFVGSSGRRGVL